MHLAQHEKGLAQTQVLAQQNCLSGGFANCEIPQLPQVDPVGLELLFSSSTGRR